MTKTQVIRILESQRVKHFIHDYDVSDGAVSGIQVATKLGIEPERVFKTLVTVGRSNDLYVFVIPSNTELDLRKAATAAGVKAIEMLKQHDLVNRTGYEHGGCSPFGMKKLYPTYIEETALLFEAICISGGRIGLQVELSPEVLASLTKAIFCDLIHKMPL